MMFAKSVSMLKFLSLRLNHSFMSQRKLYIALGTFLILTVSALLTGHVFHGKSNHRLFPSLPETREPKMAPNDWIGKQKLYPNGCFSHEQYLFALREASALQASSVAKGAVWNEAGPNNIGGRITDIAVDHVNPSTFYIAAATGGIYKTVDNGLNWQNVFTNVPVISVGAIAIDPNNNTTLWAGTGEANASSFSFIGNGIYKSVDAGETWHNMGLEQSAYFGRIVVDYSNSNRIFAAACGNLFSANETRGIFRTNDGGNTWQRVLFLNDSTAGIDIVQHPANPEILYASMWERMRGLTYRRSHGASSGIYKSIDGGDHWTLLSNGLPGGEEKGRIGLAIAQNNPEIIYAFIDRNINGSFIGTVFKSTNGGASWFETNDGNLMGMNSTTGWYFGQIRVDPSFDDRFWVMGVDLHRSEDGGNSYEQIAGYYNIDAVYVDHHAMYVDPATGIILQGNDGGLYTSDDYGDTWRKINNLPMTQFYAIEVDYNNPERIYGGTQDNNTIGTRTGEIDEWDRILSGDGFYCLVDYTDPGTIYAESQWGNLFKSIDGGYGFSYIGGSWSNDRTNWSSPLAMHPVNPEILYFGTYRVWKSINGGNSWVPVSEDLTRNLSESGYSTLSTLAVSPLFPDYLMAGSDDGKVHISLNGGDTWNDISEGLPNRWITRVAFDPFDQNTVYATVSGFRNDIPHPYVFRSVDLGQSWLPISNNLPELPVNIIVCDPGKAGRLIVGSEAGVFYSENYGEVWSGLQENMPNVPVYDLKIHAPTRTLVAGTYGCSAWKLNLDMITSAIPVPGKDYRSGVVLKPVNPNPVGASATIEFYLAKTTSCQLSVTDMNGKQTTILLPGQMPGGLNFFSWDGTANGKRLPAGLYLLKVETGIGTAVTKVMVN